MSKPLVHLLRVLLLILTPVFLFCAGVARWMMWLDAWALSQLATEPPLPGGKLHLVRRDPPKELTGAGPAA